MKWYRNLELINIWCILNCRDKVETILSRKSRIQIYCMQYLYRNEYHQTTRTFYFPSRFASFVPLLLFLRTKQKLFYLPLIRQWRYKTGKNNSISDCNIIEFHFTLRHNWFLLNLISYFWFLSINRILL